VINTNDDFIGYITWDPAVPTNPSNRFQSRTQYTATITMEPRPGFTVFGVPANFWTLTGAFLVENAKSSNVVTAKFPTTDPESWEDVVTIDGLLINLRGYEADELIPSGVYDPGVSGGLNIAPTDQFEYDTDITTGLKFIPEEFDGKFKAGKTYTAYFAVKARTTPAPGFTLEGVQADSFKVVVNDPVKGIVRATEHAANSGVITVNLGPVPLKKVSSSSAAATAEAKTVITGVKKPVTGALGKNLSFDVTAITYAGDPNNIGTRYFKKADGAVIVWDPPLPTSGSFRDSFTPNTKYTATLKLKDGDVYQLDDGMSPGFFVPNGAIVNGAWNFGDVSYIKDDSGIPAAIAYGDLSASGTGGPPNKLLRATAPGNVPTVGGQPDWNNANTVPNPYYDKTTKSLTLTFDRTEALAIGDGFPGSSANRYQLVIPLTVPSTGAEPQKTVSTDYFTGTVVWTTKNGLETGLDENGKFKPKVEYKAVVTLRPTDWYKFVDVSGRVFTVNTVVDNSGSDSAGVTTGGVTVTSITSQLAYVAVQFDATKEKIPANIRLDTLPVTGVAPSLGVGFYPLVSDSGLQFGSVVWSAPSNPTGNLKGLFGSNLVYTAKFTLFLAGSYTLRGIDPAGYFKIVDANGSVVDGVDLSYTITDPDAKQLALTAVFPATRISLQFLPSAEVKLAKQIPKAKAGSFHPDNSAAVIRGYGVIDSQYYTGDIFWNKKVAGSYVDWNTAGASTVRFEKDGREYQAEITLTAKAPYTFAGLFADGVTGFDVINGSGSPWFNLEDGKLVDSGSVAKVGTYERIKCDRYDPDANYNADTDSVTVVVDYIVTEITMNLLKDKRISHAKLFDPTPANRVPTDVNPDTSPGTLNYVGLTGGYVITKENLGWSKGALTTDTPPQFKLDWTFTATYSIRNLPNYTFKGIDDYRDLFQEDGVYLAEVQSTATSSTAVTKVILVGYSTKPGIAVQPVAPAAPLAVGGTAALSVTATIPGSTFEWYRSSTNSNTVGNLVTGDVLSGLGNIISTLTVTGATPGTDYYYCVVTAPGASVGVASNVVAVTVELLRITTPLDVTPLTKAVNESFSLTFTATGTGTITGQWYTNSSPTTTGATADGGSVSITSGSATTKPITPSIAGGPTYYYCKITTSEDPAVELYTGFVPVTVVNVRITAALSATEKELAVSDTDTVTYTATGAGTLTAQWYRSANSNGSGAQEVGTATTITSGSSTTYTIPTGVGDTGTRFYYCVVTSSTGAGSAQTGVLKVTVKASILTGVPFITPDGNSTTGIVAVAGTPRSGELLKDAAAGTLTVSGVSASGVGTPVYRWWSSTTQSGQGAAVSSSVSGYDGVALTVPSNSNGDTWYWVVVGTSDGAASITSDKYKVTVAEAFIVYTPDVPGVSGSGFSADFNILSGTTTGQLTVSATLRQVGGAGALRYTWRNSGGIVQDLGASPLYALPSAVYDNVGTYTYWCVISVAGISGIATKQSLPATVQVLDATTESFINITAQPIDANYTDTTIASPSAVSLTAAIVGTSTGPLNYTWYQITSGSTPTGSDTVVQVTGALAPLTTASISALSLVSTGGDGGKYYFYCLITDTGSTATATSKMTKVVTITVAP